MPEGAIGVRAYRIEAGELQRTGVDLMPFARDGRIQWTAPEGDWEVWGFAAKRQENTFNPLMAGSGEVVPLPGQVAEDPREMTVLACG